MPKGDNLYYAKSNLINSDCSKITQFPSIQVSLFVVFFFKKSYYMGLFMRKLDFVCEQQRRRPAYTDVQADQPFCCIIARIATCKITLFQLVFVADLAE